MTEKFSHFLHTVKLLVCMLISTNCKKKVLWPGLSDALIHEYSKNAIRSLYTAMFLSQNRVVDLFLWSITYPASVSSSIRKVLVTSIPHVPLLHIRSCWWVTGVGRRVCRWVTLMITFLLVAGEVPFSTKNSSQEGYNFEMDNSLLSPCTMT